jgi:hypothetical protein
VAAVVAVAAVPSGAAAQAGSAAGVEVLRALGEPGFLLSLGWIVESSPEDDAALVLGTEREGEIEDRSLTVFDPVYLPLVVDGRRLAPGDRIQIYRLDRRLTDPETDAPLGRLAVPTGVAVVDAAMGDVTQATIELAFAPVLVGDRIRFVTEADTIRSARTDAAPAGADGVIVAFQTEKEILLPYDAFVVRHGAGPRPSPGDRLLVYRPGPREDGRRLPDVPLGTAVAARVQGDLVIAVLVTTERSDLGLGDRVRAPGREEF